MLKKITFAIGILIILCLVALYYVYNKPHRSVNQVEAAVSASALVNAFDQNEAEANTRFLDKVIEVNGKVKEVIQQDSSFVLLIGDDASVNSVSCTLDQDQDSVVYGLKKGDQVIVRGICTGFLLDVVLVNCRVVNEVGDKL